MGRRTARFILAFLLLMASGAVPRIADGHAATIQALIKLNPERPEADKAARLQVDLLDAYDNDVPGAQIRAGFVPGGKPAAYSVPLTESPAAVYSGELTTPGDGAAVIVIEATLPDGKWYGEVHVQVGPGGRPVWQESVGLVHEDELDQAPAPAAPVAPQPQVEPQPQPQPQPQLQPQAPAQAEPQSQPQPQASAEPKPQGHLPSEAPSQSQVRPLQVVPVTGVTMTDPAPFAPSSRPWLWPAVAGGAVLLGAALWRFRSRK